MRNRRPEKKSVPAGATVFRVPPTAAAVIFAVASFLTLRGYFAAFPSPFAASGLFAGAEFTADASRFLEHFTAISCALAVFLAAYGAGSMALELFSLSMRPDERKVFSLSLGLGLMAVAVFILGHTGLLSVWPLAVLTGVFAAAGIYRLAFAGDTSAVEAASVGGDNLGNNDKTGPAGYAALAVIIVAAAVNLLGALTPETFYDSQQYQLGLPAQWLLGRAITSEVYTPASFFPMNVNMLFTPALAIGGDVAAKMVHYFCGLLAAYSLFVFCRSRWSVSAGIFAALIFYVSPAVMAVSWKTAVELGLAVFGAASFFAVVKYRETSEKAWLILSGILCGFSIGGKYTGLLYCWFPLAAMLAAGGYASSARSRFRALTIFSFFAFAAASVWFVRNIIVSGNPVFPFFGDKIGFLTLRFTERLGDPARPALNFVNYALFLWPLTMGGFYEGYLGAVFLCILPLVFLARSREKSLTSATWVYVFAGILSWATIGRFYLRYFVPVLPVVAVIFSYYLHRTRAPRSLVGKIAAALAIYLSASNVVFAARVLRVTQDPVRYVFGDMSRPDYLSTQRQSYPAPYYQAVRWINENLPPEAGVIFIGETRGLFTARKHKTSSAPDAWWFMETLGNCKDAREYRKALGKSGMTHILFNAPEARRLRGYDILYFDAETLGIFDEFWRNHVREIYSDAADIQAAEYNIVSMRREQPAWWANYSADPKNRVFVYAILDGPAAASLPAPPNPVLSKEFHSDSRWSIISHKAESLASGRRR